MDRVDRVDLLPSRGVLEKLIRDRFKFTNVLIFTGDLSFQDDRWGWESILQGNDVLFRKEHPKYNPPVDSHSYGKWQFIVDLPIKNGDFP